MTGDQNPPDNQAPISSSNQSASSDPNRPDPTIMADPPQSAATDNRPVSTISADSPMQPADTNAPLTPSNSPLDSSNTSSFGDLIPDIKPEESVIQPPQNPPPPPNVPLTSANFPLNSSNNPPPFSLSTNRMKANQAKILKKSGHLQKILTLARVKGKINNRDIRDSLRVSQSTATEYLKELVVSGRLKKEGKAKATFYTI